MNWKHIGKSLAAGAVLLLGVGWGPAAFAQATDAQFNAGAGVFDAGYDPDIGGGTESGTPVTNTAQITSFTVGGTEQVADPADFQAQSTFLVDRRLNVLVTATTGLQRVANFDGFPQLTYNVTNLSNAPIDIHLRAVRTGTLFPTGGNWAAAGNVSLNGGTAGDTLVLQNVLAGATVAVTVDVDQAIPDGLDCIEVEVWHLVAAVANPSTAGVGTFDDTTFAAGVPVAVDSNGFEAPWGTGTTNAVDSPNVIEDVFADAPGTIAHDFNVGWALDTSVIANARQGQHADSVTIIPEIANMTIQKSSRVVWDPVNGGYDVPSPVNGLPYGDTLEVAAGGEPRRIPGAIVEYLIDVENETLASCSTEWVAEGGNATATAVAVSDGAPTNTADLAAEPNPYVLQCPGAGSYAASGETVAAGFDAAVGNCDDSATGSVVFYVEID